MIPQVIFLKAIIAVDNFSFLIRLLIILDFRLDFRQIIF